MDLLLGYQFTRGRNPVSVDLRYMFIGGSSNELDGYSLTLGMQVLSQRCQVSGVRGMYCSCPLPNILGSRIKQDALCLKPDT